MFAVETKQCTKCKQYLDLSNFYRSNQGYCRLHCKNCEAKTKAKYRNSLSGWSVHCLARVKYRAKKNNLEFNLTTKWLIDNLPNYCPVLGIKLIINGDTLDNCPSLDRFDNSKGYTTDNVRIISYRANTLKRDASVEELEAIIKYMKSN